MTEEEIVSGFKEIFDRWIADAFIRQSADVPDVIYHYTDAAGLEGMLRNGMVWLTDFRFLNDRTEMVYGLEQGKDFVRDKLIEAADGIRQRYCREIIEYSEISSPNEFYVFSTSDKKDDLSQWRGYASEGRGFTIGICGQSVRKLTESDDPPFGFGRVIYDKDKQCSILSSAFEEVENRLRHFLKNDPSQADMLFDKASICLDTVIEGRAAASKHSSFSSECEWRIVSVIARGVPDDDVKIRVSGDRLVPYVQVYLNPETKKLPVKEVGIGPGFVGSEVTHAVETLLRVTGHDDAQIYFADAPYRHV